MAEAPTAFSFLARSYHVMSRGNRKSTIVDDDDDRRTFMRRNTFGEAARDNQVRVYACCLMGTHYHTLLDTPRGNLSEFIRALNTEYSKAFNRRHRTRRTHVRAAVRVARRPTREIACGGSARYIALNPAEGAPLP